MSEVLSGCAVHAELRERLIAHNNAAVELAHARGIQLHKLEQLLLRARNALRYAGPVTRRVVADRIDEALTQVKL